MSAPRGFGVFRNRSGSRWRGFASFSEGLGTLPKGLVAVSLRSDGTRGSADAWTRFPWDPHVATEPWSTFRLRDQRARVIEDGAAAPLPSAAARLWRCVCGPRVARRAVDIRLRVTRLRVDTRLCREIKKGAVDRHVGSIDSGAVRDRGVRDGDDAAVEGTPAIRQATGAPAAGRHGNRARAEREQSGPR
jgi:hypothetical protein